MTHWWKYEDSGHRIERRHTSPKCQRSQETFLTMKLERWRIIRSLVALNTVLRNDHLLLMGSHWKELSWEVTWPGCFKDSILATVWKEKFKGNRQKDQWRNCWISVLCHCQQRPGLWGSWVPASKFMTRIVKMSLWKQLPSDFLKQIPGWPAVVKLNPAVNYWGVLACLDGYMKIALKQMEEYVNGQRKNQYKVAFIQGNNVLCFSTQKRMWRYWECNTCYTWICFYEIFGSF